MSAGYHVDYQALALNLAVKVINFTSVIEKGNTSCSEAIDAFMKENTFAGKVASAQRTYFEYTHKMILGQLKVLATILSGGVTCYTARYKGIDVSDHFILETDMLEAISNRIQAFASGGLEDNRGLRKNAINAVKNAQSLVPSVSNIDSVDGILEGLELIKLEVEKLASQVADVEGAVSGDHASFTKFSQYLAETQAYIASGMSKTLKYRNSCTQEKIFQDPSFRKFIGTYSSSVDFLMANSESYNAAQKSFSASMEQYQKEFEEFKAEQERLKREYEERKKKAKWISLGINVVSFALGAVVTAVVPGVGGVVGAALIKGATSYANTVTAEWVQTGSWDFTSTNALLSGAKGFTVGLVTGSFGKLASGWTNGIQNVGLKVLASGGTAVLNKAVGDFAGDTFDVTAAWLIDGKDAAKQKMSQIADERFSLDYAKDLGKAFVGGAVETAVDEGIWSNVNKKAGIDKTNAHNLSTGENVMQSVIVGTEKALTGVAGRTGEQLVSGFDDPSSIWSLDEIAKDFSSGVINEGVFRKQRIEAEEVRDDAVREAWKQEQERVRQGKGTYNWSVAQQIELLETGRVSGFEGQHMMDVSNHPEYAGDPNNIQFLPYDAHRMGAHGGNTKNSTAGYYNVDTGEMEDFKWYQKPEAREMNLTDTVDASQAESLSQWDEDYGYSRSPYGRERKYIGDWKSTEEVTKNRQTEMTETYNDEAAAYEGVQGDDAPAADLAEAQAPPTAELQPIDEAELKQQQNDINQLFNQVMQT